MSEKTKSVVVLGAGPAGLTAAYLLCRQGIAVTVIESDPRYVGGLAKTVVYKGFSFDMGGHRFFSKSERVEKFWSEILPDDMRVCRRQSRIYYRRKLFSYPLKALEVLRKLGLVQSSLCLLSYVKARLFPIRNPRTFEQWVTNQFGRRLFSIFFKTYTEKIWGMDCKAISSDWAAQRIQELSVASALWSALGLRSGKAPVIKTLIDTFRYPRLGPGMMWEACARKVRDMGGVIRMGARIRECAYVATSQSWTIHLEGDAQPLQADHVISSIAIRELLPLIQPAVPGQALQAAQGLRYRDFIIVALIVQSSASFPDQWIYIHEPGVRVGRIQNFKAWSPDMVPDPALTTFGMEYFCFEGDGLWTASDEELKRLATGELISLGLARAEEIVDGSVVRQKKAYPVYDDTYAAHVQTIRETVERLFPTLHLVGRNGMHRYNNQDHAMMTSMLTVDNIIAGRRVYDVWSVNQDAEYIERNVPMKAPHAVD